jgi:hypothetical protein
VFEIEPARVEAVGVWAYHMFTTGTVSNPFLPPAGKHGVFRRNG